MQCYRQCENKKAAFWERCVSVGHKHHTCNVELCVCTTTMCFYNAELIRDKRDFKKVLRSYSFVLVVCVLREFDHEIGNDSLDISHFEVIA